MSRLSIRSKKSQLKQTKSESLTYQEVAKPSMDWYQQFCNNSINLLPSYIPTSKYSQPFCLVIQKITNITSNKKFSSSLVYLNISICMLSAQSQLIGKPCSYQCELPVADKYSKPICFYYHSKIDRTYGKIKLFVRFSLEEIRDGYVQSNVLLGIGIIRSPFVQEEVKNCEAYKQCTEMQLASDIILYPPLSALTFSYNIESKLQLKPLLRFIPSQTIVSSQDNISGIANARLPNDIHQKIVEEQIMFINISLCQIHIPDKVQIPILEAIRNINSNDKIQLISLQRKIVCGYHNQYQYVIPVSRGLDMIGKQATGQYTINVYQALGDSEIMKLSCFVPQDQNYNSGSIAISLIYSYKQIEYEVAIFAFNPVLSGLSQQLSVNMITGVGFGFINNLLPLKTSGKNPTIILEYVAQAKIKAMDKIDQDRSYQAKAHASAKNNLQSKKIIQELERQRLILQREKQQIQILRTQHNIGYNQNFQKRLLQEREQLRTRQEALQKQFREEVQRQIRQKLQLEKQIRMMREKIAAIEEGQRSQMPSKKISYQHSPAQYDQEFIQPTGNQMPFFRQKVNPNYLIQQDKTIPINEVKDIMAKTFQKNKQVIQSQKRNFYRASKFSFAFNSIIWSPSIIPPKSFYMVIKFFNFKQFRSDPITYIQSNYHYNQLIRLNHYIHSLQNAIPNYQFLVDPSQYVNPEIIQQDLVNFLAQNNTIIDIFDADNFLYIGQINIKMSQLFRGSKTQVMIAKQLNLVRMKGQQNYGIIQVLIKNQAVECKYEIDLTEKKIKKQIKKKVVSNNPILITKQILQNQQATMRISMLGSKNQQKNRQQKRIQMFKKKAANAKNKNTFEEIENNQKGNIMQKINQFKQKKKQQYVKKIYEDLLTETFTINPYFGQTKTFLYKFTNMSQSPSSFRVAFQSDQGELSLVKNPSQWKYYVSLNRYPVPKIYDCINDQSSFYLSPGETIPLVFKYLSFNKQIHQSKTTTVTVTKQQNNWIIGGFTLIIQSHQAVINHSYILYQPGEQIIDLIIPAIFTSNDTRVPKRLFLTIQKASAQWISEYEIMLRVNTSEIMTLLKFNMLLYEDDYFCQLRQNWLIQMYVYQGVYAVSKADQKTKFKISLPQSVIQQMKPHRIQFYSSHPDLVFEDENIQGARLARGNIQVWCQLMPGKTSVGSIQITCVSEKKQLLYGWIVQVYPYSVRIS